MKHTARKRFGQHFLTDEVVIDQIIQTLGPKPDEHLVEIGPGLGALTTTLTSMVHRFTAIELDRDLCEHLQPMMSAEQHTLICADALKFDYAGLTPQPLRIVGNLPYNISSPLLFVLLENRACIQDMHFLLQAEFVNRMVSEPGTKTYGRLSVTTQQFCEAAVMFYVEASSFEPPPRVRSAVVRLRPRAKPLALVANQQCFQSIVREAFSKRRKTLKNALADIIAEADFKKADIDSKRRPETLSIDEFARLANLRSERSDH